VSEAEEVGGRVEVHRLDVQVGVGRGEAVGVRSRERHHHVLAARLFLGEHAQGNGLLVRAE
jgi:hypothetical protein